MEISDLWAPKFALGKNQSVLTAGSCFAQHFGRALREQGYKWFEAEPAPQGASEQVQKDFNYGLFSFRTGNIYSTALMRQWLEWAFEKKTLPDEVWEHEGRFYDPFRPRIEPNGFASIAELEAARQGTLAAIYQGFSTARLFVFTLGLTEAWANRKTGLVYPMCPGTTGVGEFDANKHKFCDFGYRDVLNDLRRIRDMFTWIKPNLRMLLTVSPVPLTATASGQHVLVATTHSKSILRAAAGAMARFPNVDYFPSYEIITGIPFRSMFYDSNLRSVTPEGVAFVMKTFFSAQPALKTSDPAHNPWLAQKSVEAKAEAATTEAATTEAANETGAEEQDDELVCEEVMLDAFGPAR